MSHYTEEYDDSPPESLAVEFGSEVATAMTTGDQLTSHLRDRFIEVAHDTESKRILYIGFTSSPVSSL